MPAGSASTTTVFPYTLKIEVDKAQAWIDKGAQPSNTVKNLLARARKAAGAVKA